MTKPSRRGKWYGAWHAYLGAILEEKALSVTQFAELVHDKQNNVSQYVHGVIRPPLDKVEHWSRRLRLTEGERRKFIYLAKLGHSDPDIVRHIQDLERRIESIAERAGIPLDDFGLKR